MRWLTRLDGWLIRPKASPARQRRARKLLARKQEMLPRQLARKQSRAPRPSPRRLKQVQRRRVEQSRRQSRLSPIYLDRGTRGRLSRDRPLLVSGVILWPRKKSSVSGASHGRHNPFHDHLSLLRSDVNHRFTYWRDHFPRGKDQADGFV